MGPRTERARVRGGFRREGCGEEAWEKSCEEWEHAEQAAANDAEIHF